MYVLENIDLVERLPASHRNGQTTQITKGSRHTYIPSEDLLLISSNHEACAEMQVSCTNVFLVLLQICREWLKLARISDI